MRSGAFRLGMLACLTAAAVAGAGAAQEAQEAEEGTGAAVAAATPEAFGFAGSMASTWDKPTAGAIAQDAPITLPLMIHDRAFFDEGVYVWDAWPIRELDGSVAEFEGWVVMVGLSAEWREVEDTGEQFFTLSELRYWYTRDGEWRPGGLVFPRAEGLGSRQWAGSAFTTPRRGG